MNWQLAELDDWEAGRPPVWQQRRLLGTWVQRRYELLAKVGPDAARLRDFDRLHLRGRTRILDDWRHAVRADPALARRAAVGLRVSYLDEGMVLAGELAGELDLDVETVAEALDVAAVCDAAADLTDAVDADRLPPGQAGQLLDAYDRVLRERGPGSSPATIVLLDTRSPDAVHTRFAVTATPLTASCGVVADRLYTTAGPSERAGVSPLWTVGAQHVPRCTLDELPGDPRTVTDALAQEPVTATILTLWRDRTDPTTSLADTIADALLLHR